ncbi:hypothetical protein D3C80_1455550 [compost metagenome]
MGAQLADQFQLGIGIAAPDVASVNNASEEPFILRPAQPPDRLQIGAAVMNEIKADTLYG